MDEDVSNKSIDAEVLTQKYWNDAEVLMLKKYWSRNRGFSSNIDMEVLLT